MSDLLTTTQAAQLATRWRRTITGDQAATVGRTAIINWETRGHLQRAGLDDRGRPLFRLGDIARAEQSTRLRALQLLDAKRP